MRRKTKALAAFIAIAGSLVLSSCSDSDLPSEPSYTPFATATDGRVDRLPREDLRNEEEVQWDSVRLLDDQTLRIKYRGNPPGCGEHRFELEETDTYVQILLFTGKPRGEGNRVCQPEDRPSTMLVRLESPLGDRVIRQ